MQLEVKDLTVPVNMMKIDAVDQEKPMVIVALSFFFFFQCSGSKYDILK